MLSTTNTTIATAAAAAAAADQVMYPTYTPADLRDDTSPCVKNVYTVNRAFFTKW